VCVCVMAEDVCVYVRMCVCVCVRFVCVIRRKHILIYFRLFYPARSLLIRQICVLSLCFSCVLFCILKLIMCFLKYMPFSDIR